MGTAPDQMRLDLVTAVVTDQQVQAGMLATPLIEQPIARKPGRLLDTAFGLLFGPDENLMTDTSCRQPIPQLAYFRSALRTQPVIDGNRADLPASLPRPTISEDRERKTVGATGYSNSEKGRAFKPSERIE
jgi:hypothetical protein